MFYRNDCEGFMEVSVSKIYEGAMLPTNNFGNIIITKYVNKDTVHVKFLNTGYEVITQTINIRQRTIKDRLSPVVFGVGILGDALSTINGKRLKEYELWKNMLKRCYDNTYLTKHPTYKDCSVSDDFKFYPNFKNWCNNQVGFKSLDDKGKPFQLDKDILVKGNKVYSENTCAFVPKEINMLSVKCNRKRGKHNIGVYYRQQDKKFVAKLKVHSKNTYIGCFDTETEAFIVYKQAKECYIKEVANKWKDKIDIRVYEALINYQVEITD